MSAPKAQFVPKAQSAPTTNNANDTPSAYAQEFGISTVMGAAVGVATRRLTSDALYGAGLCFVGLQSLAYMGYIQVNWVVIGESFTRAVDQNSDGKLDMADVKVFFKRAMGWLSRGLPNAAGFTSGFLFGAKYLA